MFSKERVRTFVQGKVKELWLMQSFAGALKKTKTMHTLFFLKKQPELYIIEQVFLARIVRSLVDKIFLSLTTGTVR